MLPEVTAKYTDWTQRTAVVKILCSLLHNFSKDLILNPVTDFLICLHGLPQPTTEPSWQMGLLLLKIIHSSHNFQWNKKYMDITMLKVYVLCMSIIA